jgi:ribosome-binding protein aMBF1 (putative translation factor)
MSVGKESAASSATLSNNVHPLVHTFSVTQLSQKHNDFDALMAELENDPANAHELATASAWVADTYYAHEGETLRTARLHKGLSQVQLSVILQTSQAQVAKIESGKVDLQHSTLLKLGAALDLDANTLFRLIEAQSATGQKDPQ